MCYWKIALLHLMKLVLITVRSFSLLILCLLSFQSKAQEGDAAWMLEDLLSDSSAVGEIVSFETPRFTNPFFLPNDLKLPGKEQLSDVFIKTSDGLFALIDGTGRVYKVLRKGDGIDFVRIDSTFYSGYNFGAFNFTIRDTIFSIGGYGLWRNNGHLRYFQSSNYGWEIMPLNTEIPMGGGQGVGIWLNYGGSKICYTEKRIAKEWLKEKNTNVNYYPDTARVWELDLDSKNWSILGVVKKEAMDIMKISRRLVSLPWGELVFAGPRSNQTLYLVDYASNQISLLGKEKAAPIIGMIFNEHKTKNTNKRCILYFKDSIFHIVTSLKEQLQLSLKHSDFTPTAISIYVPTQEKPFWMSMSWLSLVTFSIGVVLSIGAIFFTMYKRRSASNTIGQSVFNKTEVQLIRAIFYKSDHVMTTEEINFLLGTIRKSIEVQKKHRSDIMVSINKKYKAFTGDEDELLDKQRIDNDKRLIRYFIHPDKYKKIASLIEENAMVKNGKGS